MLIKHLELQNFRNYERADFAFSEGITVFLGDNAQGKTNLLEAAYLCCVGRSHRTAHDRELVRFQQDAARVYLEVERRDGMHDIEISVPTDGAKRIKVFGKSILRSGELMGHVNGVLFSPEDLRMVKEGPAERRRLIDMELAQISASYYYALQRYNRALKQRGKLLREAREKKSWIDTLDIWDDQLASSGAEILLKRRAFVRRLQGYAVDIHARISDDLAPFRMKYTSSMDEIDDKKLLTESMVKKLLDAREQDIKRGITSVGPHRDDLALSLGGVDMRLYGSQGQQRTCALTLKLSGLSVMRDEIGEWPILMLDDVMSELDPGRRRKLLQMLDGVQVFVTCTDLSDLSGAAAAALYRVDSGAACVMEID